MFIWLNTLLSDTYDFVVCSTHMILHFFFLKKAKFDLWKFFSQKKVYFLLYFDYFHYFCTVFIICDNSTKALKWRK